MPKLLVLGGTGFVGRALCNRWSAQHGGAAAITVATRRLRNGSALRVTPLLHLVEANVHDEDTLARLLEGHDAVVNLIGVLHASPAGFEQAHAELPRRLARACAKAGVRRVIQVSALGADAQAPSHYLRSKAAGEEALRDANLDLTIVRPSVVFGADDAFLNLFARMQAVLPLMAMAGVDACMQPVWVQDLASALVATLLDDETHGQVFEAVGPDVATLGDLVRLAGRLSGHPRPVFALPWVVARAQAWAMEFMPNPLLSRDALDSLRVPSVASGLYPTLEALGIQPSSLASVAPTYLGPQGTPGFEARGRRRAS